MGLPSDADGKKLKAAKSSKFYEEAKRYEEQASEEREKTVDEFNRAFTDRGIDPNDPLATQKLLMAKSLEAAKTVDSSENEAFEAYGGGVF